MSLYQATILMTVMSSTHPQQVASNNTSMSPSELTIRVRMAQCKTLRAGTPPGQRGMCKSQDYSSTSECVDGVQNASQGVCLQKPDMPSLPGIAQYFGPTINTSNIWPLAAIASLYRSRHNVPVTTLKADRQYSDHGA
jgi:hypothetical protein